MFFIIHDLLECYINSEIITTGNRIINIRLFRYNIKLRCSIQITYISHLHIET